MDSQHVRLTAEEIQKRTPPPLPVRNHFWIGANVSFLALLLVVNAFILWQWSRSDESEPKSHEWHGLDRESRARRLLNDGSLADWLVAPDEIRMLACTLFSARHTSVDDPVNFASRAITMVNVVQNAVDDAKTDGVDLTKDKIVTYLQLFQKLHDGSNGYRSQK